MSGPPTDNWMQFYHSGLPSAADATVVTTTSSTSGTGNHSHNQTQTGMSPESGRVSKPARKRSRASRRTPTTLLNTDKSNFRAMVQQFTGGPAFGSGSVPNNPNFMAAAAFGLGLAGGGGARGQAPAGGGVMGMMGQSGGGYQLQYQQQQQVQFQQQSRNGYSNMVYSGQGQDPSNTGGLIQRLMMEEQGQADGASTARPNTGGSNENSSYLF